MPRPLARPRWYIKEDLIIPNHLSFYDLIVTKARGKSGPLFHFDVRLRGRSCATIRFRCIHSSARGRLARPFVRCTRGCTHARRGTDCRLLTPRPWGRPDEAVPVPAGARRRAASAKRAGREGRVACREDSRAPLVRARADAVPGRAWMDPTCCTCDVPGWSCSALCVLRSCRHHARSRLHVGVAPAAATHQRAALAAGSCCTRAGLGLPQVRAE